MRPLNNLASVLCVALLATAFLAACDPKPSAAVKRSDAAPDVSASTAILADESDGKDWAAFGRTFGEQHFSPLDEVNVETVGKLGLVWSMDLEGTGNSVTGPLAINGVLYFARGLSVVHAVDAATGKLLWVYDPHVAAVAGIKLRQAWGSRGIAWWNGKLYTGTLDGRLIAIDAQTGKPVWSVQTMEKDSVRYISGPPRAYDGKVIIGNGGADGGEVRGYVTTYDAQTGQQLWRFYTVPGDPAQGFENKAMEMAAKTWSGPWWKFGGGGTVWNAMTYDAEQNLVYLGTGNGYPWNYRLRSAGKGDNLFLCSVIALDATTGEYRWHYQFNPGETWDYNAAMDMQLAVLDIDGKPRKVLVTAPKNGYFYVIDRTNGKLISAEPIAKVTWASKIDIESGRPVENPLARFPNGSTFELWPGVWGAHTWLPMAFSPRTRLTYIPVIEKASAVSDAGIDLSQWKHTLSGDVAENVDFFADKAGPPNGTSHLTAWDPVTQKPVWSVATVGPWSGGVMATGGGLVFQGAMNGQFSAFDASSGRKLWSFAAQAVVIAPPITYSAGGRQHVTVLTGVGTSLGMFGQLFAELGVDARTQKRRVLTFALGGTATLPQQTIVPLKAPVDPTYKPDSNSAARGSVVFYPCSLCHGLNAIGGGIAPDLRASSLPLDAAAFNSVLRDGALEPNGMPKFPELSDSERADLRQYIRSRQNDLRHGKH